jgi:hypothetical protein
MIELNLTEEEFNLIWGVMNQHIACFDEDTRVQIELLNKMEDKIAEIDPDFFGELDD